MILLSWVRFIPWYEIGDILTGAACGVGNAYPSGAPYFTSGFQRGSCCPVICVSFFHMIVFSFGFRLLIVPFVWLLGTCIYIFYFFVLITLTGRIILSSLIQMKKCLKSVSKREKNIDEDLLLYCKNTTGVIDVEYFSIGKWMQNVFTFPFMEFSEL